MIPYIPHTEEDRERMLAAIGLSSIDELFADIPSGILLQEPLQLSKPKAEEEVIRILKSLSEMNMVGTSFLGLGSYDRIIPSAVKALSSLPAFVTAYTPYQPEISQGLLQAIFEFQTMICELTGLDVSNASLYDGHTAAPEAAAIMLGSKRKSSHVLVSSTIHPYTLEVLRTWAFGTGYVIELIDEIDGVCDVQSIASLLRPETAGVIVQSPNKYGLLEEYEGLSSLVHEKGSYLAISSDPLSLVMQRSQQEWGADIAIGDTQPLGLPTAFGGPSCGYIAVKEKLMRKLPGRVVGETVDVHGKRAFTLTLQAREQHIKRERATSNICSNQALAALTTTMHLSLVGYEGMREAALQSYHKAHYLQKGLLGIAGINAKGSSSPFWCEFPLVFAHKKDMEALLAQLKAQKIHGGVRLGTLTGNPSDEHTLIVAVTEKRTRVELDAYIAIAKEVLS